MHNSKALFDLARKAITPPHPGSIDQLLQHAGECRTQGLPVTEDIFLKEAARRRFDTASSLRGRSIAGFAPDGVVFDEYGPNDDGYGQEEY